ncbi:hypothetical protein CEXT_628151 [Caerostris extrusa]|uniref:Uncharacterized protein n=1 Tax=Caerostris extrusa TaxID=172846 RepID=A0AAV4W677_CAEEX|nr:hypothetical protein CEXT_628151 [Caerostris extrusa]
MILRGMDLFRSTPKYLEPASPEMLSNLTNEERCARISPHSYEERHCSKSAGYFQCYNLCHALDEDDHVKLKTLEQDLDKCFERGREILSFAH